MTPEQTTQLKQAIELQQKATPGPWSDRPSPVQGKRYRCLYFSRRREEEYATSALLPEDARFLSVTRTLPLAELRAEVERLREALEDLHDEQNGPPLLNRADRWQAAMDKAEAALGIGRPE